MKIPCESKNFTMKFPRFQAVFLIRMQRYYYFMTCARKIVFIFCQLPADGTFSIRLDETNQGQVMLLDTETGVMTDLSNGVYTFTESAGTYTRRFIISVIGNTTALQNAASGDESVMKILEDNRVFIIRGGEKYDVLGNKQ